MTASGLLLDRAVSTDLGRTIQQQSLARWGEDRPTIIIGRHASMVAALERLARFALSDSPVLIMGETGTGKELFARALYLLSPRSSGPLVSVNCAQYQDGHLIASELFGHRRGSFTGAIADHCGVFEEADGGAVMLDEIGELPPVAQAMLLRALSEGEIVPVGAAHSRKVNVRVIAATSRDLKQLVEAGQFRMDLYYRLRYLSLSVPPVRERGGDWELILNFFLERLSAARACAKHFSTEAMALLHGYSWPGNVRELKSMVETGFHLSDGETIEPVHFLEALEGASRREQLRNIPLATVGLDSYARLVRGEGDFWDLVRRPFMNRELSRADVRQVITRGLAETRGSYKRLLQLFGIAAKDYLKFMDFLRHHDLKPDP